MISYPIKEMVLPTAYNFLFLVNSWFNLLYLNHKMHVWHLSGLTWDTNKTLTTPVFTEFHVGNMNYTGESTSYNGWWKRRGSRICRYHHHHTPYNSALYPWLYTKSYSVLICLMNGSLFIHIFYRVYLRLVKKLYRTKIFWDNKSYFYVSFFSFKRKRYRFT